MVPRRGVFAGSRAKRKESRKHTVIVVRKKMKRVKFFTIFFAIVVLIATSAAVTSAESLANQPLAEVQAVIDAVIDSWMDRFSEDVLNSEFFKAAVGYFEAAIQDKINIEQEIQNTEAIASALISDRDFLNTMSSLIIQLS